MLPSLEAFIKAHNVAKEIADKLRELDEMIPWGTLAWNWTEEQLAALDEREEIVTRILDKEV